MTFTKIVEETRGPRPTKLAGFKPITGTYIRRDYRPLLTINLTRKVGHIVLNVPLIKLLNSDYAYWAVQGSLLTLIPCSKYTAGSFHSTMTTNGKSRSTSVSHGLREIFNKQPNLNTDSYLYRFEFEQMEEDGQHYIFTDLSQPTDAKIPKRWVIQDAE